jgi:cell surface protein SprA
MNLIRKTFTSLIFLLLALSLHAYTVKGIHRMDIGIRVDTPSADSNKVRKTRIQLKTPPNVSSSTDIDTLSGGFVNRSKIGTTPIGPPRFLTLDEYLEESRKKSVDDYFRKRSLQDEFVKGGGILPSLGLPQNAITSWLGGTVDLHPQGSAELIFGVNSNRINNPALSPKQRHVTQFNFDQNIQLNLTGNIGDKIKINAINDTKAIFDFDNIFKLNYTGKEDEIVKKVEMGNVGLPLNSNLINPGQSLFGIKAAFQFGRLNVTTIVTQNKGKSTTTEFTGGAQTTNFDLTADNYDVNRHYFLGQFFREHYDEWLSRIPLINSAVQINKVEVWITNRNLSYTEARDVLAFTDLGEANPYNPSTISTNRNTPTNNYSNNLYARAYGDPLLRSSNSVINRLENGYPNFASGVDYQLQTYARKLTEQEYTMNPKLGYISLNSPLNNGEVLAVAYEYTYNGQVFKVGEFSAEIQNDSNTNKVLMVKLLKGNNVRPDLPTWKLMMKNIYSLNAYAVQQKDFKLNIIYKDEATGTDFNFIPAKNEANIYQIPLIKVLNCDNINSQGDNVSDGVFDFIEGTTIIASNGRIIFPCLEPFGSYLKKRFADTAITARSYVYQSLYDSTKYAAQQDARHNRFYIRGSYQGSASNVISLNAFNIPQGSVKVTAGGAPLREGVDYSVDYLIGKVTIINTSLLQSGAVIKVQADNNNLFNTQQKSLIGTRLDYKINKDFILGSTFLRLSERPLTQNVSAGDEPLLNTIIGFDGIYKSDSRFITKLIDKLPFISTKEVSSVILAAEYAKLMPGVPKSLDPTKKGFSYIDDFEGAEAPYDLRTPNTWYTASTPQGNPIDFPTGNDRSLRNRFLTARMSWYFIDQSTFYNGVPPSGITSAVMDDPYQRLILQSEVYPDKQLAQTTAPNLQSLDIFFNPKLRGEYNFNVDGLNADGTLGNPKNNWGGIMRKIETNDFEAANIDYISIWLMDPFYHNATNTGDLIIQLGNVSEDILPDGRKSFENGLPKTADKVRVDTTQWGLVSKLSPIVNAFDVDETARQFQDVGLDGLSDAEERTFFDTTYLSKIAAKFGTSSKAYQDAYADPAADDYHYYLGADLDNAQTNIINRYRYINNAEGNSPTSAQSMAKTGYQNSAYTSVPDGEDIDRDFLMNTSEDYFQYRVRLDPNTLVPGQNFVTDKQLRTVAVSSGSQQVYWYQLKIPIQQYEKKFGSINDFKSIRFMRLILKNFEDSVIIRMGEFQLVRSEWRKCTQPLRDPIQSIPSSSTTNTRFDVATVNIEQNSKRQPINYVIPPGINRQLDPSNPQTVQLNEQSLSMITCNLQDDDARGAFRNTQYDFRNYKHIRLFTHAEEFQGNTLTDGQLWAFIRIGTDYTNNYYEYSFPLKVTLAGQNDPAQIWPEENHMDLILDYLSQLKQERDLNSASLTSPYYSTIHPGYKIVGTPDISSVKIVCIGVRNPKDDGLNHCGQVWFDELRLEEFNNTGGWAAEARADVKLADLGNVRLTSHIHTYGYGALDQKLNERSKNDVHEYAVVSNFELGKFFPIKAGINIPLALSYSESIINPHFNPLNPDVPLQQALKAAEALDPKLATQIQDAATDFTSRYGLNLINVRKNHVGTKKPMPWSISNFTFSYQYNRIYMHNPTSSRIENKSWRGMITYVYAFPLLTIQPFTKISKSKWLKLVTDVNVNLLPSSFNFRVETNRRYNILQMRNNDFKNNNNAIVQILPTYDKDFTMNRVYDLQWALTRNLKLNYNANNGSRIPEPLGAIETQQQRDTIMHNFFKGGDTRNFIQNIGLNYQIPFNKIPFTDWITSNVNYNMSYNWTGADLALIKDSLGNQIQNSKNIQIQTQLNFTQLYNKWKFLKKINEQSAAASTKNKASLEEEEVPAKGKGKGKIPPKKKTLDNKKKPAPKVDESKSYPVALRALVKIITGVKNASFNYTTNAGSGVPGFMPTPNLLGENFANSAPGWDFILGKQIDTTFLYSAARRNWISDKSELNTPYTINHLTKIDGRISMEPFTDFRIDISFNRQLAANQSGIFKFDTVGQYNDFRVQNPLQGGTFSTSFIMIGTAFKKDNVTGSTNISPTFRQFQDNRYTIAQRLQNAEGRSYGIDDSTRYPRGYSQKSQDVVLLAFLAAYTGKNAGSSSLNRFPKIPLPNWRINYNGLSKLPAIRKYFNGITLSHSYSCTYSTQYSSSFVQGIDSSHDFIPGIVINSISLNETFSPLAGIDVTLKNSMTFGARYNQSRTLGMQIAGKSLSENKTHDFTFSFGYRTSKLYLPFRIKGKYAYLENDINFKLDVSLRDNLVIVRQMDVGADQAASGNRLIKISPNIDYMLNQNLNMKLFFDITITNPHVSNQFPTTISAGGISLRYTLDENFLKNQLPNSGGKKSKRAGKQMF